MCRFFFFLNRLTNKNLCTNIFFDTCKDFSIVKMHERHKTEVFSENLKSRNILSKMLERPTLNATKDLRELKTFMNQASNFTRIQSLWSCIISIRQNPKLPNVTINWFSSNTIRLASHGVRVKQGDGQKFHEIQYPARRYHMYRGLYEVESSDALTKKTSSPKVAHLSPMCHGQISFQKIQTHLSFNACSCYMKVSKGSNQKQQRKSGSTIFPIMRSIGVFLRRSRAANSVVGGPTWPKFELIHNIMHVLVTSKFEKDRININRDYVMTSIF